MSVKDNGNLKIAIASHGLGLITRGTEMWAKNLSYALKDKTLDVTLYKGWGQAESEIEQVLPCIKRDSKLAKKLVHSLPSCCWRIGCGSIGDIEATTFSFSLIKEIIKKKVDIVHTADPQIARVLVNALKLGIIKTKIIFANAIPDEPLDFISKFGFVQQRTPYYIDEAKKQRIDVTNWYAIPNFVDVEKFRPEIKTDLRAQLAIPQDVFVVLCVAAIDQSYKRVDYLIREISDFCAQRNGQVFLILAGAERAESKKLIQMGKGLLKDKVKFLFNQPHDHMAEIYASSDIFVLCSINEVFGIAFIEAMACGIPAIGHIYPPTQWVIGSGGDCVDMTVKGNLTRLLEKYLNKEYRIEKGRNALHEVRTRFTKDAVVNQIIKMYEAIVKKNYGTK